MSDGNWFDRLTTLPREEGVLVGVDAAVVLQLQMVATVCSAGVYDITKVDWLGWLQVGDGCDITW